MEHRTRQQPPSSRSRTRGRESRRTEMREVRAADPELSPEVNAELTAELREVIGSDRAEVPVDRPRTSRGELPSKRSPVDYLSENRVAALGSLAIMLTFGGIVALTTGDWWLLPLAAGIHALATLSVVLLVVRLTTITEHPSPDVAAALAAEGVSSPDERFSQMVEEFTPIRPAGVGEVLSPGHNDRTVPAGEDPAMAMAEQSSAMTPTEGPTRPAGEGSLPELIVFATALALLGLSVALPAALGGGWLWLLTAVMVPLLIAWLVVQLLMARSPGTLQLRSRVPLIAIAVCTALAVAGFCAVVALAFQH